MLHLLHVFQIWSITSKLFTALNKISSLSLSLTLGHTWYRHHNLHDYPCANPHQLKSHLTWIKLKAWLINIGYSYSLKKKSCPKTHQLIKYLFLWEGYIYPTVKRNTEGNERVKDFENNSWFHHTVIIQFTQILDATDSSLIKLWMIDLHKKFWD